MFDPFPETGRALLHEQVRGVADGRAGPREVADELLVIEEDVAVVMPDPQHRGATKGAGAGIIGEPQGSAIDKHPGGFHPRPPRQRREEILWADDFEIIEQLADTIDLRRRAADVVIGEDDLLGSGEIHAGVDAVYLVVQVAKRVVDFFVSRQRMPRFMMLLKDLRRRAVHDEEVAAGVVEDPEVIGEFGGFRGGKAGPTNREEVGAAGHLSFPAPAWERLSAKLASIFSACANARF